MRLYLDDDSVDALLVHHHGILIVRRDNNPRRDMTQQGVVRAI
ncbi:MAG TPA: hypothetical protein VML55_25220 [Planctomycetaceae bacterium]|nr:hypothetical protein [Planctomycetaceae bacterium]